MDFEQRERREHKDTEKVENGFEQKLTEATENLCRGFPPVGFWVALVV